MDYETLSNITKILLQKFPPIDTMYIIRFLVYIITIDFTRNIIY